MAPARKSPTPDYSDRVRIEKYDLEVGPLRHLAEERQRLRSLAWQHFDVVPLGASDDPFSPDARISIEVWRDAPSPRLAV